MSGMLQLRPEDRLTAAQAIMHPFFNEIRDPELESILKSKTKSGSKTHLRVNNHKDKFMKRLKNKNSLSPGEGGSKEGSKPRANRFSDVNMKYHKEIPLKSSSKGPSQKKIHGKPPINFKDSRKYRNQSPKDEYLPSGSSKIMPSNFSNFYIPFSSDNPGGDQYGYDINIDEKS